MDVKSDGISCGKPSKSGGEMTKSDGNLVQEGCVASAKMGGNLSESGEDSGL